MPRDDFAVVQIVMGSKSDALVIEQSRMLTILEDMDVGFELSVCSAHRNARELAEFVGSRCQDGADIFIGVAGMAAALPGALAADSHMAKPIIAVPLDEHGIDSCLYMPPGVPVLTAGVGEAGLKNAAIAACQILAVRGPGGSLPLHSYHAENNKPPQFNVNLEELTK